MDQFMTVFGSAQILTVEQILCSMLLAFVVCSVLAKIYCWTFNGLSYSRSFVHTIIVGGMVVSMLIMAIGNNLARGLGILGTLAIVRFRTPIRDTRDMIFLFASLGLGIACGANVYNVAIVGTLTISGAFLLLHGSPFASRREYEGMLRFALPAKSSSEEDVRDVLRQFCSSCSMIGMREAAQGDLIEYSYHVRLLDPSYQSDLIETLHGVAGLADATLLMQRATVEL